MRIAVYIAIFIGFLRRVLRKMTTSPRERKLKFRAKVGMDRRALYMLYEGKTWYCIPYTDVEMTDVDSEESRIIGLLMPVSHKYSHLPGNCLAMVAVYDEDDPELPKLFPEYRQKYGPDKLGELCRYIDECLVIYRRETGT